MGKGEDKISAALKKAGYDAVSSASILELVCGQTFDEAKEFLSGLLGESMVADSVLHSTINSTKKASKDTTTRKEKNSSNSSGNGDGPGSKPLPSQKNMYKLPLLGPSVNGRKPEPAQKTAPRTFSNEEKASSIKELDAALRRLELHRANEAGDRVKCTCMGSRHGLFELAPNCLNCGRIICNEEGLGVCLTCNLPLVDSTSLSAIYDILSQQRSSIVSTMGKKALQQAGIDPSTKEKETIFRNAEEANANLERLLNYQSSGAVRTRIIDQAADFDTPDAGQNIWMTAEEQALQLRKQQHQLRKQEELRKAKTGRGRKVISVSVRGNKVYQEEVDAPLIEEEEDETGNDRETPSETPEIDNVSAFFDAKKFNDFSRPQYPKTELGKTSLDLRGKETAGSAAALSVIYDEDSSMLF